MHKNVKDLTGKTFGKLYVLELEGRTKARSCVWKCLCSCKDTSCKNIVSVRSHYLICGATSSCGCIAVDRRRDNLTGSIFGRLTVLGPAEPTEKERSPWICECGCKEKTIITVRGYSLKTGHTKSCGCLHRERVIAYLKKCINTNNHGLTHTRAYKSWLLMMYRCYNPDDAGFKSYGGRLIEVCIAWHDVRNFFKDMGERPVGYSIERNDVNGNYEPDNCCWIPRGEQSRNRRISRRIEFQGQTKILVDWSTGLGIDRVSLACRLKNPRWSFENAMTIGPMTMTEIQAVRFGKKTLDQIKEEHLARRQYDIERKD